MTPAIQCVPNFSEGRDSRVMEAIVDSIRAVPGVRLADWSADPDHHRMVVTFVGAPEPVMAACRAAASAAVTHIDLSKHEGIHPRLGAIDVLPLVPLSGITLEECVSLARTLGQEIANAHDLPVFLYEAASEGRSLPYVRREAFGVLAPDFGPPVPHPTAGALVLGARLPLIAFNANLVTDDLRVAKQIARELREGGGSGFIGVRALGLFLHSKRQTQVSMNVTRPAETSLASLTDYIVRRAEALGTQVSACEVIGALPGRSAYSVVSEDLRAPLHPGQILWEDGGEPC